MTAHAWHLLLEGAAGAVLALTGAYLVARAPRPPLPSASLIATFICAAALAVAAVGLVFIAVALGGAAHPHGALGAPTFV